VAANPVTKYSSFRSFLLAPTASGSWPADGISATRGELAPDGGAISLPRATGLGRAEQEAPGGPRSLIDFVLAARSRTRASDGQAEVAADPYHVGEIQTRLVDISAHAAPAGHRASWLALASMKQRSNGRFSNFPAAGACASRSPRFCFRASHDRDLLDAVCNHIMHLDQAKLILWRRNYSSFERQQHERQALALKQKRNKTASTGTFSLSSIASAPRRKKRRRPSFASLR
jgi:ATP-binding cassette, subfamily F, member 3